jgi:hypothetical protein
VAVGIVANAELTVRGKREIDRQVGLALIEPPAHVLDLIGERPASGVRLAQAWERLADSIERHRLGYALDVDRHGPLGPEPAQIAAEKRHGYGLQRGQIASEIEEYRQAAKLPELEQAREIGRQRERNQGLDLAL